MKVRRWIVLLALLAILMFVYSQTAHAEYYLVYGVQTRTVAISAHHVYHRHHYVYRACYHPRRHQMHHVRVHAHVVVTYAVPTYVSHCSACGCQAGAGCFNPLTTMDFVPVYMEGYSNEPVREETYPMNPYAAAYHDHYDPDLATGDDDQVRYPDMEMH